MSGSAHPAPDAARMRVIRDVWAVADPPRATVAAIGNFDGLHRGQQAVLASAVERARALARAAAVITFEPHPLAVLQPGAEPPHLLATEQREELLAGAGVDALLEVRFTPAVAALPADEFARRFLAEHLAVTEVHVGSSFAFGHNREGNVARLARIGRELGFGAVAVPEVLHLGAPISATRIRAAVAAGDLAEVAAMLGRPYAVRGAVARGAGRGRAIGWPTMNLQTDHELLPAEGVYVTEVELLGRSPAWPAVTNVGRRPTFQPESSAVVVESHLFDFGEEVYGAAAEVRFLARLRGEMRFPGPGELAAQIGRDAEAAREYFRGQAG